MIRYRITTAPRAGTGPEPAAEQTWVLLPNEPSAVMQAQELAQREKSLRVRVYREVTGQPREQVLELPAVRFPKKGAGLPG